MPTIPKISRLESKEDDNNILNELQKAEDRASGQKVANTTQSSILKNENFEFGMIFINLNFYNFISPNSL